MSDLKPIVAAALYFELPFAYFMGLNRESRTALLLGDLKLNVFSLHDAHGLQALLTPEDSKSTGSIRFGISTSIREK